MCLKCDNPEWTEIVREQYNDIEIPVKLCGDCYEKFLAEVEEQERSAAEKLELAKKIVAAMEFGAEIEVVFHSDLNFSEEKGKKLISQFADDIKKDFGTTSKWLQGSNGPVKCVVFFKMSQEEKIANLEKQLQKLKESDSHERTA